MDFYEGADERSEQAWSNLSAPLSPAATSRRRLLSPERAREFEAFIESQRTTTTITTLLFPGSPVSRSLGEEGEEEEAQIEGIRQVGGLPVLLMTRTESAGSYGSFASGTFPLSEASFASEILPASPALGGSLPARAGSPPAVEARGHEEASQGTGQGDSEAKEEPAEPTTPFSEDTSWTGW